ncbi:hypothetical protein D3C78_964030 [compost metagenome]
MLNGRASITRAARQAQHVVFALAHVVQRFECWRCRAKNNRDLFAVCAVNGQIAGVIAPAFLLFIGAVVFFVDHDDAEIFKRCKQRRAGTNHNCRFAVFGFQPGAQAFRIV